MPDSIVQADAYRIWYRFSGSVRRGGPCHRDGMGRVNVRAVE